MPRSTSLLLISVASGCFLSGCESAEVHVSPATSNQTTIVAKAINKNCPIHPAKKINPKVQADKFKGSAIGFCSDRCEIKWKRWTLQRRSTYRAEQLRN